MHLKKLLAMLTALVLAMSCLISCGIAESAPETEPVAETTAEAAETAEAEEESPVVITVGSTTYTKAEVQALVDSYISYMSSYYAQYGQTLDTTDPELIRAAREAVCGYLVEAAVKDQHAAELGVSELTDAEMEDVRNEYMSYFYQIASMMGVTDYNTMYAYASTIQQYVQQYYGVTYSSLLNERLEAKLVVAATTDVTVTEEKVIAAYENALEADKTGNGSSASAYDTATSNGTVVLWRPEGMRYVKNLLVKFSDADSAYMSAISTKAREVAGTISTAYAGIATDTDLGDVDQLVGYVTVTVATISDLEDEVEVITDVSADAEATVTDLETPAKTVPELVASVQDIFPATEDETTLALYQSVRDYASSVELYKAYVDLYQQATADALAALDATADAALAELAAGADWDTVMAKYTEDPGMGENAYGKTGYLVYEGKSFDSAFLTAALALENVGDYTGKIAGSYGYYIIQFASAVEPGAVPMEEVLPEIEADALATAKAEAFTAILEQWVAEADAVINYELMD